MKRKLIKVYDRMTMPEDCARRIEANLVQAMDRKNADGNIRHISPVSSENRGWIGAVCGGMAVLCVCGCLMLRGGEAAPLTPPETAASSAAVTGDYSLVTGISAQEVEAFASSVRQNVLEENWEAFSEKIHYPIAILDQTIAGEGGFVGLTIRNKIAEAFVEKIRQETCSGMFCNWQGICMADGRIWINEVDGELKITAINAMFTDLVSSADFFITEMSQGRVAITGYTGMGEDVAFPAGVNQNIVTQIGTGSPVIHNGEYVRSIRIPDGVTAIGSRAFADCPALQAVFFQGNPPEAGTDIFAGSENLTVYYPENTSGWEDVWCGRPAYPYTHLSLGTVQTSAERQREANVAYDSILRENQRIDFPQDNVRQTISDYCERKTAETGKNHICTQFTLADMDGDGVSELILRIAVEGGKLDHLILRYQENDGMNFVYCYAGMNQQMSGLNKDGSFFWEGENPRWVGSMEEIWKDTPGLSVAEAAEKIPVRWHSMQATDPSMVLDSYVTVSQTARGEVRGGQFFYFENLIQGKQDTNWETMHSHLTVNGFRCEREGSSVWVYDPASAGCVMFGVVDDQGRLETAGYYFCDEAGEWMAEVRGLSSDKAEYRILMNQVFSHGELGKPVPDAQSLLEYLTQ